MGLTIAVGFVVDDAIVMLENVFRYIEDGMSPMDAAIRGAGEIGFTIISISVSLIAVFIPLLLMGGIVGRLFSEFAIVVSITILISALVSLTLTPMMCSPGIGALLMLLLFRYQLTVIALISIILLIGIVMVGGLLRSQVLTLYTTPVIYLYLERLQHWLVPRREARLPLLAAKIPAATESD